MGGLSDLAVFCLLTASFLAFLGRVGVAGPLLRHTLALGCRCVLLLAVGAFAAAGGIAGAIYPQVAVILLVAAAWLRTRRGWVPSGHFGTARLSGMADVLLGGLSGNRGWFFGRDAYLAPPTRGQALRSLLSPFVGSEAACKLFFAAFFGSRRGGGNFIRISDGVHAGIFAPAGAGKTTKVLGPNLLSFDGNCVIFDPRGELYRISHRHRQKCFGHDIIRLDPAGLCGPGGHTFNPFDYIDPKADDFIDSCRDLANMLAVRTGKETEAFWADSAETVIAAFISYVCTCHESEKGLRHLRTMRSLIASRNDYAYALEQMQKDDAYRGVLKNLGFQLAWHVDKQLSGVMGHAQRFTDIFDSPRIVDAICSTNWKPEELRSGKGMSVYIIVPPDKLVVWAGWTRMVLGCLLRIATRGTPGEQLPLTFFVDEVAHLGGRMQALEDGITLMRGMGIRIWLFLQSIDQLNKCFGDHAPTVMDNLATQLYFSTYSYATAEALAKRIGSGTVLNESGGDSDGESTPQGGGVKQQGRTRNRSSSRNYQEAARQLIMPEEILTLDDSCGLLFHKNHPVILCRLVKYYDDRAFRWRWWRWGWGTGRSAGLGLTGMAVSLCVLAMACIVAVLAANLPPPPVWHRPGAGRPGGFYGGPAGFPAGQYGNGPRNWPVEPWRRPPWQRGGGRPLPYPYQYQWQPYP